MKVLETYINGKLVSILQFLNGKFAYTITGDAGDYAACKPMHDTIDDAVAAATEAANA